MAVRKAYVDTSAGQMHYRHQVGVGAPVVFLHRTPVCSSSFERVFEKLVGWRPLYAFDTPGFGESFTPRGPATAVDFRDWFIEAIDSLNIDEFSLCGHHTGSHFAIEIAALLSDRVQSLIIDGAMYISDEARAARKGQRSSSPTIDPEGAYLNKTWEFIVPFYPTFSPETVHQEFIGAMRSLSSRDVCLAALMDQSYPEVLSRVRCPTHACAAEDDVYVDLLTKIKADAPRISISTYGKAGIAGPELQSSAFANIVRDVVERSTREPSN